MISPQPETPNSPEQLMAKILAEVLLIALKPVMTELGEIKTELNNYSSVLEALIERIEALEQSNQSVTLSSNQGLIKISNVLSSQFQQVNELKETVSLFLRTSKTGALRDNLNKLIDISFQQIRKQIELSRGLEISMQISHEQMKQHKELSQNIESLTKEIQRIQQLGNSPS